MAKVTNLTLRHKVVYQIFIRNFTKEGTFKAIIPELPRIKAMGIDIIGICPINPSSNIVKVGELGSPFAPRDYYAVDEAYGTFEDFIELVHEIHKLGMQVTLDMDFHHTAIDSVLLQEHPEYFLKNAEGMPYTKLIGSEDIYDLDFSAPGLWDYLFDVMRFWAKYVDGFYCNLAALVRQSFWTSARQEVEDVHPFFYWMGESLKVETMRDFRRLAISYNSDGELFNAFDVLDDSDMINFLEKYRLGQHSLSSLIYMLNRQEVTYPSNYVKFRKLEEKNRERFATKVESESDLLNWTALSIFIRGCAVVHAGQEFGVKEADIIFDKKPIKWTRNVDMSELIQRASKIKKREAVKSGYTVIVNEDGKDTLVVSYHYYDQHLYGIFSLKHETRGETAQVLIPNGRYQNLLDDDWYDVVDERITIGDKPIVIAYDGGAAIPIETII